MKYKIIAVDMDGTLLNDDKHITDINLDMISKAVNEGVKFVISSGRIPSGLKFYGNTVSKKQPMICCNGAIILDENKEIIYSKSIDKKSILRVIDVIREKKDTYFHFYDESAIYSEQFRFATERFYNFNREIDREFRVEIRLVPDAKEVVEKAEFDINKIVVIDDDIEYLDELRKRIDGIIGIETTKSEINNIEILSKGVSKGNALKILANDYGIPIEECIAIGNDENDISMIDCAGLGVAVNNARDSIKRYADYITEKDNNNDAIAEVIQKFILGI
ncbi:Cof-type HAD-IIB family hydrolase [Clostridium sp. OS1-26]|uniref:Cof-type HAD-IIB family hydrolase n=1 Tax=Clostridium sp. OS1-26 TaxID=3070681 RepID=UPI0027DFA5F3|nr:Cof-type HAD-IIB family hydrolase [Clostridium sp. OS1-26]WML35269.1 Cof-type HAD-IIB family hydrolase [Clostridium sp. OS1-26]